MNHTKVIEMANKVGGFFRLAVLLQKRVRELVGGAPKLLETEIEDPVDVALLEIEHDLIELVDLSDEELKQLEAQTQMATEEAELLEALRSRVTRSSPAAGKAEASKASAAKGGAAKAEPAKAEKPAAEAAEKPAEADADKSDDDAKPEPEPAADG